MDGVSVQLITPREVHNEPVPGASVSFISVPKGRYANWAFGRAVGEAYRREGFDLLRVFSPRYVGAAGWIFHLRHAKVPVAVNHHHLDPGSVDFWLTWLCGRFAEVFTTVSEFSKRQLVNAVGARPERVHVVSPGISESYAPGPVDRGLLCSARLQGQKIVLFVGGLKPRKNLSYLLGIFPEILGRAPEACLVLVGDGQERGRLEHQAAKLGIANSVRFMGFVSEADKLRWLHSCDVFVSPSRMEGFGMNVAEAMACRKPVVVSKAGSLPEVVEDGTTGYVVPLSAPREFARAIVRLLESPSLRAEIGIAGQRRVRSLFRWERAASQVKEIYAEAIERRKRA